MMYFLLGVLAPVFLNLIHMIMSIYVVVVRGNSMSLLFTGVSFITKSIGMLLIMYLGIETFQLDFKIFIPLLSLFFLLTHFIEAFVVQYHMKQNVPEWLQALQIK
jgi:uncharacterized protein YhhL (DUF1145 family)